MYIIYKIAINKTYGYDDFETKADIKFISHCPCQSEATKMCNLLNKERTDKNITYKYGYLKD
jgi:GTP cyclohydrolase FolE2